MSQILPAGGIFSTFKRSLTVMLQLHETRASLIQYSFAMLSWDADLYVRHQLHMYHVSMGDWPEFQVMLHFPMLTVEVLLIKLYYCIRFTASMHVAAAFTVHKMKKLGSGSTRVAKTWLKFGNCSSHNSFRLINIHQSRIMMLTCTLQYIVQLLLMNFSTGILNLSSTYSVLQLMSE